MTTTAPRAPTSGYNPRLAELNRLSRLDLAGLLKGLNPNARPSEMTVEQIKAAILAAEGR